jgi:hypothetical protein
MGDKGLGGSPDLAMVPPLLQRSRPSKKAAKPGVEDQPLVSGSQGTGKSTTVR